MTEVHGVSISKEFAHFIATLRYEDIPEEAHEQAAFCLLDAVGNMIAGADSIGAKYPGLSLLFENGTRESSIIGGTKTSARGASFVNAVMARSLDLDDGHRFAMGHPGSVLIPVALSISEHLHLSGREMIAAIVAAYEIYARSGSVINPRAYSDLGFESTGICGAIASAALIAKCRGMDEDTTSHALGIAASFSGGLIEYQNDGSHGKYLCPALAGTMGFQATDLALGGFTGPVNIFEGKHGFFHAHGTDCTTETVLNGLGSYFGILDTYFKIHCCMRGLHASIDSLLTLTETHGIMPNMVEKITVKTTPFVKRLDKAYPTTLQEAQSNLPFVLITALLYGKVDKKSLLNALENDAVRTMKSMVSIVLDEDVCRYWEANPSHWGASRIEILLKAGRLFAAWTPIARGEKEYPLSRAQLIEKFMTLVQETSFYDTKERVANNTLDISQCSDVADFMRILSE